MFWSKQANRPNVFTGMDYGMAKSSMVVDLQCLGESLAVVSCCRAGLREFSAAGIFGGVATVLWGGFGGGGSGIGRGMALISVFGDCFSFLGSFANSSFTKIFFTKYQVPFYLWWMTRVLKLRKIPSFYLKVCGLSNEVKIDMKINFCWRKWAVNLVLSMPEWFIWLQYIN